MKRTMRPLKISTLAARLFQVFVLSTAVGIILQPQATSAAQIDEGTLISATFTQDGMVIYRTNAAGLTTEIAQIQNVGLNNVSTAGDWIIASYGHIAIASGQHAIAFTAAGEKGSMLFIYEIATHAVTEVAITDASLIPLWSPDGTAIVLTTPFLFIKYGEQAPYPESFIYDLNQKTLYQITDSPRFIEREFLWTADSQSLIFVGRCLDCNSFNEAIYVIDRDGTDHRIIASDFQLVDPSRLINGLCNLAWSPNFDRIFYEVGCLLTRDLPIDALYSTNLNGDNRLEFELNAISGDDLSREIKSIQIRNGDVYLITSIQGKDFARLTQIMQLTSSGKIEAIYEMPEEVAIDAILLAPDAESFALIESGSIRIIHIPSQNQLATYETDAIVCELQWISIDTLVFNKVYQNCSSPDSVPAGVWSLAFNESTKRNLTGSPSSNDFPINPSVYLK